MSEISEQNLYASVGRAVSVCQFFEFMFTVCVKLVIKQPTPPGIDQVVPLDTNSFKSATKTMVQELKKVIEIDPFFEHKVSDFIDRRHTLIHRWFLQHGWPDTCDQRGQYELMQFALSLAQDGINLSAFLAQHLIMWMKRVPEMSEVADLRQREWEAYFANAGFTLRIEKGQHGLVQAADKAILTQTASKN